MPMSAVLRTRTTGETAGFMKVLVEAAGDCIVGFTMIDPEAGEVTAAVQTAILGGLPFTLLRDAILTHPTMAEGSMPCSPRSRQRADLPFPDINGAEHDDFP
jgi:pyruvate/2-oxoglutarate dehydrogenase complex dihydrolipoamide dehydrogenase (E3) component